MLVAQATLDAATDALTLAEATKQRVDALGFSGDISRQRVDEMTAEVGRAQSNLLSAKNSVAKAGQILLMHQAAVSRGTAELASAAWRLSRTAITAPGDGTINNLAVRIGDMARADVPLIGIVDAHAWRIVANYRQIYIRQFYVGQTAWVWLDSEPGRFYRARIEGVGRGISRDPVGDSLLAFAVIIVWEKFSDAERTVAQEAGAAATLYRLADGIGGEPGAALRSSLTHYVRSAVTEGWPAMERGEASRAVTRTLDATYVALMIPWHTWSSPRHGPARAGIQLRPAQRRHVRPRELLEAGAVINQASLDAGFKPGPRPPAGTWREAGTSGISAAVRCRCACRRVPNAR